MGWYDREKLGKVNQKFPSVSQIVYIANIVIFLCSKLILSVNTI